MEDYMTKASQARFRRLLEKVRRWSRREPEIPADPFADHMAPIRRGPKEKSGAAAVAAPDE